MAVGIGDTTAVVTVVVVEVKGTWMGDVESSSSSDSWMMSLGLFGGFWWVCVWACEEVGGFLFLSEGKGWSEGSGCGFGGCMGACVWGCV